MCGRRNVRSPRPATSSCSQRTCYPEKNHARSRATTWFSAVVQRNDSGERGGHTACHAHTLRARWEGAQRLAPSHGRRQRVLMTQAYAQRRPHGRPDGEGVGGGIKGGTAAHARHAAASPEDHCGHTPPQPLTENRSSRQLLPTPASPMMTSLYTTSWSFSAITAGASVQKYPRCLIMSLT